MARTSNGVLAEPLHGVHVEQRAARARQLAISAIG
jgi:hypothetical protein